MVYHIVQGGAFTTLFLLKFIINTQQRCSSTGQQVCLSQVCVLVCSLDINGMRKFLVSNYVFRKTVRA